MLATTNNLLAPNGSLRANVLHSSMIRKMQSVWRDTAGAFRRSTSLTGSGYSPDFEGNNTFNYSLLGNLECALNIALDEFLIAISPAPSTSGQPSTKRIAIERSETQWEEATPEAVKAALVAAHGERAKTRQNAIHELYLREMNLCHDLLLSIYIYERPLVAFALLTPDESALFFGSFEALFRGHFSLVKQLLAYRNEEGVFDLDQKTGSGEKLAQAVLNEIIGSENRLCGPYEAYLFSLKDAQKLLKTKLAKCRRFAAFNQLPLVEQLNRKLGLAAFLDAPRSLLMKLGLLFGEIAKVASTEKEAATWRSAIEAIGEQISSLNEATALAEFRRTVATFWLGPLNPEPEVTFNGSTEVVLRSRVRRKNSRFNRGKPTLMLFNKVLVLARRSLCRFGPGSGRVGGSARYYILASINTGSVLFFDYGASSSKALTTSSELHLTLKTGNAFRHFQRRSKVTGSATSLTTLSRRLKKHQQGATKSISRSSSSLSSTSSHRVSPTVSAAGSRRSSGSVTITTSTSFSSSCTLHLFSLDVKSFNVTLKFASAHEVKLWKGKLAAYFTLLPGGGAVVGGNGCGCKLTKSNSDRSVKSNMFDYKLAN